MPVEKVAIEQVLMSNYMPYAEGVIKERAVPDIAGLKPVNTRILHAMYRQGQLKGKRIKCAGIVGETMKCHPNGDSAIYEALVRMTDKSEYLLAPTIKGKGNFGKSYSSETAYAASRYTEATLMPIAAEFFDGLEDDAVDMVPNFDNTMKEPKILPVKFPNILVNPSAGIAVGMASNIPSFNLRAVCEGTVAMLTGKVDNSDDLMEILGAPDFATGGYIHLEEKEVYKLGRTGRAGFYVSGDVTLYKDAIVINQIPYCTTVERIINGIKDNMKTDLKEVDSVKDLMDLNGMRIEIRLKGGADCREVLNKLRQLTELTCRINFNTAVIVNGEYRQIGVYELLQEWIDFRENCVRRVYTKRYGDVAAREHKVAAFEIVSKDLAKLNTIMDMDEDQSRVALEREFGLDDIQIDFLEDCKRRDFHADKIKKRLEELKKLRETMREYKELADNKQARYKYIVGELEEISEKYGEDRRTKMVKPFEVMDVRAPEVPDNSPAIVLLTKNDNVIKLSNVNEVMAFEEDAKDPVVFRISTNNASHLLLFSQSGICYKLKVGAIPHAGRTKRKEYLNNLLRREDGTPIIYADDAGDYSGSFNVLYSDGGGVRVFYNRFTGNRTPWHNCFDEERIGRVWITKDDRFFVVTRKQKAAFARLENGKKVGKRAFKVTRIDKDDTIIGIQPINEVPDWPKFEADPTKLWRYESGYTVCVRDDILWEGYVVPDKYKKDPTMASIEAALNGDSSMAKQAVTDRETEETEQAESGTDGGEAGQEHGQEHGQEQSREQG